MLSKERAQEIRGKGKGVGVESVEASWDGDLRARGL